MSKKKSNYLEKLDYMDKHRYNPYKSLDSKFQFDRTGQRHLKFVDMIIFIITFAFCFFMGMVLYRNYLQFNGLGNIVVSILFFILCLINIWIFYRNLNSNKRIKRK